MEHGGEGRRRRKGGGGEARRIQIVYFLSRNGRIEQPHLIRVHYHHFNCGVRLRDVKGWLSQLRGKGMPESYSWAYKRSYRTGYVWQDIVEDDIITAIVDNEYVLKGSFISPPSEERGVRSFNDDEEKQTTEITLPATTTDEASSKSLPPLPDDEVDDDHSPVLSTITTSSSTSSVDASTQTTTTKTIVFYLNDNRKSRSSTGIVDKEEREKPQSKRMEGEDQIGNGICVAPSSSMRKSKSCKEGTEEIRKILKENQNEEDEKKRVGETLIGNRIKVNSYSLGKGRNNGGGRRGIAEHVFKNLIICGGAETHESALMPINRFRDGGDGKNVRNGGFGYGCIQQIPPPPHDRRKGFEGKTMAFVGEFVKSRMAYGLSPVAEPYCTQCGKAFKPEMLHSHMKSCKGLKEKVTASSRSANSARGQGENGLSKDVVPTFLSVH